MSDQAKKVLLVEDEEDLLDILQITIETQGHEVFGACSGQAAIEILNSNDIDLIISDFQMPNMTGLELLDWVRKNRSIPFLLMTGHSTLKSTMDAEQQGLNGYLTKPFSAQDLVEAMTLAMFSTEEIEEKITEEYYPIMIDHFFSGYEVPFNVFIKMNEDKFQKIVHTGEELETERLSKYRDKGVKELFLRKEDFHTFANFQLSLTRSYLASSRYSEVMKSEMAKNLIEDLLKKVTTDGLDEKLFENSQAALNLTMQSIVADNNTCYLADSLMQDTAEIYDHCLLVSLISTMVAKHLGYTNEQDLMDIATGAIFHRIGAMELNTNPLREANKEPMNLEPVMGNYPEKGFEILGLVPSIRKEVRQIVLNHLDVFLTSRIHTDNSLPSKEHIVCLVNIFCENRPKNASVDTIKKYVDSFGDDIEHANKEVIDAIRSIHLMKAS